MKKATSEMMMLLGGVAVAGVGFFVWSKRATLFPTVAPPAPLPDPTQDLTYSAPSNTSVPAVTTTQPIYYLQPSVGTPTPAQPTGVVVTPYGNVQPSNFTQYSTGTYGGQYNSSVAPAQVSDAQRQCSAPVSNIEIATAMAYKPSWTQDYTTTRLSQLRAIVCDAAQRIQTTTGNDQANWITQANGALTDYKNLTGVTLIPPYPIPAVTPPLSVSNPQAPDATTISAPTSSQSATQVGPVVPEAQQTASNPNYTQNVNPGVNVAPANVTPAQTDCSLYPSDAEINTAWNRNPTTAKSVIINNLIQLRSTYCASWAAMQVHPSMASYYQGQISTLAAQYYALTGVQLSASQQGLAPFVAYQGGNGPQPSYPAPVVSAPVNISPPPPPAGNQVATGTPYPTDSYTSCLIPASEAEIQVVMARKVNATQAVWDHTYTANRLNGLKQGYCGNMAAGNTSAATPFQTDYHTLTDVWLSNKPANQLSIPSAILQSTPA